MKIRMGFVSNSSSSSFIVDFAKLDVDQANLIRNHISAYREIMKPILAKKQDDRTVWENHMANIGCWGLETEEIDVSDGDAWETRDQYYRNAEWWKGRDFREGLKETEEEYMCTVDNFDFIEFIRLMNLPREAFRDVDSENGRSL
jgi:hypothetical protein